MKTPVPGTDTEVAQYLGWGKSGTRGSGLHLPASSTRQVDRGVPLSSRPPQVATRPEDVVKVTWRDLGLGREGAGQLGEEGNTQLELSLVDPFQPPVSRILVVVVMSPEMVKYSLLLDMTQFEIECRSGGHSVTKKLLTI